MKQCPFCAQNIGDGAVTCPFCGRAQPTGAPIVPAFTADDEPEPGPATPAFTADAEPEPGLTAPAFADDEPEPGPTAPAFTAGAPAPGPTVPKFVAGAPAPAAPTFTAPAFTAPAFAAAEPEPAPAAPAWPRPGLWRRLRPLLRRNTKELVILALMACGTLGLVALSLGLWFGRGLPAFSLQPQPTVASASPTPARTRTPTPALALVSTLQMPLLLPTSPLDDCTEWSLVTVDDVGKTLCVYGAVFSRYTVQEPAFKVHYVKFGDGGRDFYLVSYDWAFTDLQVGDCLMLTGPIQRLGNNPVIAITHDNILYRPCP